EGTEAQEADAQRREAVLERRPVQAAAGRAAGPAVQQGTAAVAAAGISAEAVAGSLAHPRRPAQAVDGRATHPRSGEDPRQHATDPGGRRICDARSDPATASR